MTKDGFSLYWNFSNCNSVVVSITSIAKNQVVGSLTLPNNYTYNFKVGDSSWGREFEVKLIPDGNTDRPHYVRFGDKENRVILPEPDPTPTQEVVSWENAGVTSAGFTVHFWFPNCKDVVVTITSKALNQVVGSLTLPNDSTYHFGVENLNWGREYEVKLAPDGDNNRAHYVRNGNVENQVTLPEPANIEEGTYRINSRVGAKNSYVSVDTSSGKEGANVRLWENTTGAAYQKWIFTYLETNKYGQKIYSIRSSWSGYALEVENLAEEYGSNVKTGKYTGKDSQKWILEKRGDYYYIISLNGTFLDVVNGNDANGTNVQTQVGRKDNAAQVYKVTSDQPASTTAPTVSNVQITNISKDGYTVMCDATDDLGIRNVEFSSWTSRNGQDDIVTADGKISGDSVWYRVNTSDHNSEKGGVYNTKISANDIDGHTTEYTVTVYVPANNPLYTVECKEADDRKTVDVKVSVKNLTEIYSGNFDLIYDNERLQPESYSFSGSLNESIADCDLNYGGFGNTVSVSFSDDEALEQTGVVTVTFAVLGDGNTTFPITNANAFNENGDAVDVETEEGSINIVTGQVPVGENDPQIVIDKKTARAGDTVQLAIVLKNAEALKSIALSNIAYDTEHLELTEGKWLTENGTLSDVNLEKKVAAIGFANNTDCNGEIFLFTFTVKEGTADAVYPVSCNITAKRMVGEDEVPYTVASVSGSIEVVSVKKGDTNGDNKITSDDAIYLLYHTLLPSMYPINQKADFNGDGKVTSDDAIYLLYHTLLPSMYPLT